MESEFAQLIHQYQSLIYLIVFAAVIIEGDISLLLFGVLARERIINYLWLLPVAITAAVVHDLIFWKIGRRLSKIKRKKYLFFDFDKAGNFLDKIKSNIGIYIILSKFAWNFNRVVIVSSGYLMIPIKKFLKYSVPSAFLWVVSLTSLGYAFADQTRIFHKRIGEAAFLVVLVVVIMIVFEIYLKEILRKYFFGPNTTQKSDAQKNLE